MIRRIFTAIVVAFMIVLVAAVAVGAVCSFYVYAKRVEVEHPWR